MWYLSWLYLPRTLQIVKCGRIFKLLDKILIYSGKNIYISMLSVMNLQWFASKEVFCLVHWLYDEMKMKSNKKRKKPKRAHNICLISEELSLSWLELWNEIWHSAKLHLESPINMNTTLSCRHISWFTK